MKAKNEDGIRLAILFFIGVFAFSIILGVLCNLAYKIF
jgi:hypothetical protein